MDWFSVNKDVIGIGIGLLAILISLITVLISRRRLASSFLAVQTMMLADDLWRGRLMIYQSGLNGVIVSTEPDDVYLMVRALATFDLMGAYARRGIVPRRWVLDYWHPRLQVLRRGYEVVNSYQHGSYPGHDRPDLLDLMARAERHPCRRECCAGGQIGLRLGGRSPDPDGTP
ncbi:hypothetical protein [Actinoplanes friuliensis]|uniref:Uncharacterized protein n=1 Tax=Actinoplanes friuliensis DSM 7358 TaxID=1246995 RepID=U5W5H8_9ACTN|nr:hypothetical protein [Actinoplanes friuliensis]AGZ44262.1 hypothetical protein AFR_30010 [Actinoplanes friuliensis DSM 7358]